MVGGRNVWQYGPFLQDAIEEEKAGISYKYSIEDRKVLDEMLEEISYCGRKLHYLAELDNLNVVGSGPVMAQYIRRFSSEGVRAYLIPQIVSDRVPDCDKLVLELYQHFKNSDTYFPKPGESSPAYIYVRYDNAFRVLKPKRLKEELIKLAYSPHDISRLPFTVRMLASWKLPEIQELLIYYSNSKNITPERAGILGDDHARIPLDLTNTYFEVIKRRIQFWVIDGLKYYPSSETERIITSFLDDPDEDIRASAQKTLKVLVKKR